ncbi:MAG: hypothetical protein DWQ02_08085 [Bacteroidetes bacterium]|nr:MAG: hypothetical protein DWQ02_08085 [Bacteroidota bacterium]
MKALPFLILVFSILAGSQNLFGQVDAYNYHYQGLVYAKNEIKNNSIETILAAYNSSYKGFEDISLSEEQLNILHSIIDNNSRAEETCNTKLNELESLRVLTTNEMQKFRDLHNIIFSKSSLAQKKIDLISLKRAERNTVLLAAYDLTISSIDFWPNHTDGTTAFGAVQLDAAGYLIGWVVALTDDIETGGDVSGDWDSPASWRRIKLGLAAGLLTSIGKF